MCSLYNIQWMRARWTSDPCYAFYGVDGSDCSFLIYLSEVEWFCPPLAWRNHSSPPIQHAQQAKAPKRQVREVVTNTHSTVNKQVIKLGSAPQLKITAYMHHKSSNYIITYCYCTYMHKLNF